MLSNFAYTPQCLGSLISGRVVDCRRRSESSDRTPPSNGLHGRSANLSNSTDTSGVFVMARVQRMREHACAQCGVLFRRRLMGNRTPVTCSRQCCIVYRRMTPARDFWPRVSKAEGSGCWEWLARTDQDGYGRVTVRRKSVGAHRVSWEMANGPIPEGLCVLHHCDNPPCVRPDHLFLGTNLDNSRDRGAKGRQPHGERNPNSKLTEERVFLILAWLREGVLQKEIARRLNVCRVTIHRVSTGKAWAHITGAVDLPKARKSPTKAEEAGR